MVITFAHPGQEQQQANEWNNRSASWPFKWLEDTYKQQTKDTQFGFECAGKKEGDAPFRVIVSRPLDKDK